MKCEKSLTINQTVTGDMPFSDAVYVASVNKIFGAMGPYVVQCNASTGAKEAVVRVAPVYGESRLTYLAATNQLFVSLWNDPANQQQPPFAQANRQIFPVDPVGFTVGTALALWSHYGGTMAVGQGPRFVQGFGNRVYFGYSTAGNNVTFLYYDAVANTYRAGGGALNTGSFEVQHIAYDPIGLKLYVPYAFDPGIRSMDIDANYDTFNDTPGNYPVATVWCAANSKAYAVCGTTNLIRVDNQAGHTNTVIDISTAQFNADPCRIRYNPGDQKLYMPCMTAEGIVVWDPALNTGTFKAGFTNPIDVVFTGAKIFAVQNSAVGLKEIT